MQELMRYLKTLLETFRSFLRSPYFGFVQGHSHLTKDELQRVRKLVGSKADAVVLDFERQFARLIGSGEAVAYATGRMGFYELMRLQGIGVGEEVILLGATCSVMVNAVIRTGATPVYADIDPETFGSSSLNIEACITSKTRMIVAQHSFGIPCNIEPISKLAKDRGIFLLEDCALTLGSEVNGVTVGNFGDAALFSTDHGKPLNTLTGGLIYTLDTGLANRLRVSQSACAELSVDRQKALWRRLLLEARYCNPLHYGRMALMDLLLSLNKKIMKLEGDFLSEDFGSKPASSYPYPAKLPAFLAAIGLLEVRRWPQVAAERESLLSGLLQVLNNSRSATYLPKAYSDKRLRIVPLRLAWWQPDGDAVRHSLAYAIKVSWTFFMKPIIATSESLSSLGYRDGSCPISEKIGPVMLNLPCNIERSSVDVFMCCVKTGLQ